MLHPVFKKGVEKGVTDYLAKEFQFFVGDMLSASDAAAKKKARAKFERAVEVTNETYKAAIDITEEA